MAIYILFLIMAILRKNYRENPGNNPGFLFFDFGVMSL